MTQAIIFDVDGTLVDSVDLHAQAWVDAFHDFGHEVDFEDARGQIGKGGDQLLPVFLTDAAIANHGPKLEEHRGKIFKDRYMAQVTVFPMVRELFEHVLANGQKVGLASSAKQDELQSYKQIANIADLVETEISSSDAQRSKPHPDIFQAALDRLGCVDPADIVVIGDTPYDAEAAAKAGLRSVGLLCGGWSADDLKAAGCIAVYRDPADLLANYDRSPLAPDH